MIDRGDTIRIYAIPAAVTLLSVIGLMSALVGNGWWDYLSWLGLGAPAMFGIFRARRG